MRLSDLVTGSAFALLGLFAVVYAQGLPSPGGALGAGLFPTIIGGVMALSGIALVVKSIVASSAFPFIHVDPWMKDPRKITALVAIPVAIAAFGLFSASIGTIAVAAIILAIVALIWGDGADRGGGRFGRDLCLLLFCPARSASGCIHRGIAQMTAFIDAIPAVMTLDVLGVIFLASVFGLFVGATPGLSATMAVARPP